MASETFDRQLDLAPVPATFVSPGTPGFDYVLDGAVIVMGESQDVSRDRKRAWVALCTPKDPG